jgi:hypothetical protein
MHPDYKKIFFLPVWFFIIAGVPGPVHADFTVDSPRFEKGLLVLDSNNNASLGHRPNLDHTDGNLLDISYGVTGWWQPMLQGEWDKAPNTSYKYTITSAQNIFALSRPNQYWLDPGIELNYNFSHRAHMPDAVETKLLLEKNTAQFINTANIIINKDVGAGNAGGIDVGLAWKTEYLYTPMLNPGFEYFGNINGTQDINRRTRIGPVFYGDLGYGISYELGWLFGISGQAPDNTIKLNLSFEFPLEQR